MGFQYYLFNTTQVALSGAAAQILPANTARSGVNIVNTGTVTAYIGNSNTVTTGTGYPLAAGASIGFATTLAIFGITGGTAATVGVLETQ